MEHIHSSSGEVFENPDSPVTTGVDMPKFVVPFVRTPYNYDMDKASVEAGTFIPEETMTKQSFAEECDINTIVRRFGLTGELPSNVRMPESADFTEVVNDYQSALNMLRAADDAFMEYPAEIRQRFDNDPGKFIAFAENPDNLEECRKLGLAKALEKPPAPLEVRVVPDPAPGPVST